MRLALVVLALTVGCSSLGATARTARDTTAAAEVVRADAPLAGRQCRAQAGYEWWEARLLPGSTAAAFPLWYDQTSADGKRTWAQYCEALDHTGELFHTAVLALRDYGRALLALAGREDFDASGLAKSANGVAAIAGALDATSPVVDAAKAVAGPIGAIAAQVEKHLRAQALRKLVDDAAPHVRALIEKLQLYLDALEAQRATGEHHRAMVVKLVEKLPSPTADAATSFDLARGGARPWARTQRVLARDRALLDRARAAHDALASVPFTEKPPPELATALDALEATLGAIAAEPPENDE
jgi:hypothetical protein